MGENTLMIGTDCGLGRRVHPQIAWAKLRARFHAYGAIWNRRPGGAPAMYSTIFRVGTETSLQTFRIFINWVGASQSLFDSQVTFVQVVCFSQEHTVTGRLAASTRWGRYQVPGLSVRSSKCNVGNP